MSNLMLELDKVVKSTNLIHTNENQRKRKNTTNGSEPQKKGEEPFQTYKIQIIPTKIKHSYNS